MQTILTLTVREFHFVDDLLLLACMITGIFGFLFLKYSCALSSSMGSRSRLALDLAGITTLITSLCFFWLNKSWNNAFELAGSSYAASGHFFREDYRYVAWFLTAPLLITSLVAALPLAAEEWKFFLPRVSIPAAAIIFFSYLVKMRSGIPGIFIPLISYLVIASAFFYMMLLLWKNIPQALTSSTARIYQLLFQARRFLFITWLMYPLIDFLSARSFFTSSTGFIFILAAYTLTDVISQCGLGLYVCALLQAEKENSQG